jgi:hypothetical protein
MHRVPRTPLPRLLRGLSSLAVAVAPLIGACENDVPVVPIPDGAAACEELVRYCEGPAAALGEPYQSCYDTGTQGDGDACLNVYDQCVTPCYDASMSLPGNGGAAGQSGAAGEGGETNSAGGAAGR